MYPNHNKKKNMADYKTTQNLLSQINLPFFTFYTKGEEPVKAVIRQEEQRKKKFLTLNKYMAMGPSGARRQD
jgi:hypothetical protein